MRVRRGIKIDIVLIPYINNLIQHVYKKKEDRRPAECSYCVICAVLTFKFVDTQKVEHADGGLYCLMNVLW